MSDKKSLSVISSDKKPAFIFFIISYFVLNEEYLENGYPFTLFYNYKDTEKLENIIKTDFSMQNEIFYETENKNAVESEINEEPKQLEYKKVEKIEFKNNENVENSESIVEKQQENTEKLSEDGKQEVEKRFCIIINSEDFMVKTADLDKNNIEEIDTKIEVPENIIFLENSTKKERKNAKNIFVEYLPIEEKMKLKKLLTDGEKIYSDYSVNEIL